jgi:hypothetical protein
MGKRFFFCTHQCMNFYYRTMLTGHVTFLESS